jgi:hypothetical protein
MAALSPTDTTTLVLLAFVVLLVVRRSVRMAQGTPLSMGRVYLFTVVYLGLYVLVAVEEILLLPIVAVAAEAAVVAIVGVAAAPFVERRVHVYRDPSGGWAYRIGVVVPVVYIGLFVGRLAIDVVLLGVSPFAPPPVGLQLAPWVTAILAVVDGLYAASTGLLMARTVAIRRAYVRARAGERPLA